MWMMRKLWMMMMKFCKEILIPLVMAAMIFVAIISLIRYEAIKQQESKTQNWVTIGDPDSEFESLE